MIVFTNPLVRLAAPELIDCPLNGFLTLNIVCPLLVDRDEFIDLTVVETDQPHLSILRQDNSRKPFNFLKKFIVIMSFPSGIFQSSNFSSDRYRHKYSKLLPISNKVLTLADNFVYILHPYVECVQGLIC